MGKSTLFLIDAHALCYRAFFAVQRLSTSYGQPTNAVFGFLNTLRKILKDHKPDYMAACFDVGKKTHRQEKFAEYKVHRPPMPDDLISQIPLIKELVLAYNIPVFELEGFEADDVIATITRRVGKDVEVVIVSGDKDMIQLVEKNVKIFDYRKNEVLDASKIEAACGFAPRNIVDFIALAGDSTDNIPGVMGIGKVTATELLKEFGSLDNILKNADRIKSKSVQEKIRAQKDAALMSHELALLDSDVPIDFKLNDVRVLAPDTERLRAFFDKLEFRKFSEELGEDPKKVKRVPVKPLTKVADVSALCRDIEKKGCLAFTMVADAQEDFLSSSQMFVACQEDEVFSVSVAHLKALRPAFADNEIVKVCFDVKEQLKIIGAHDLTLNGRVFDVMLAGYLLSPSQMAADLDTLAWKYLKASAASPADLSARVLTTLMLFPTLEKELKDKALFKLFEEIEIPLAFVLYRMSEEGVGLDEGFLKQLSKETNREIQSLTQKLYKLAGEEFNLNSPKQLSHILFDKLKLPVQKKTKTGFSTDEGVLTRLASAHELPAVLLEYRQLTKLTTTYIDALPKLVDPKTSRIHAVFDQAGTETGRLSSRNPNLQNIPIRTEFGRQIRKAFVPRAKNYAILSADYSQIELRILAHLSKDETLIQAFKKGEDIHNYTAALIFDVKEDKVTKDMRTAAKRVNFGIVYGMSAFGLAKDLGVPQKEAQEFIDKYFLRYPKVQAYMQEMIQKAEDEGFVTTLLNRRRYIPEIHSDNISLRQFAQRQAINTPVQGSAADLIKLAMVAVQKKIDEEKLKSRMIITVHDELVFDVLKGEEDAMVALVRQQMESPLKLSVPIEVTVKVGANWLETEEVKR